MAVILSVVLIVAGILLYDYFTARRWQQVTSSTRNEIVFEARNKEYGAYVLRRDYDKRMVFIILGLVLFMGLTYAAYQIVKNLPEEVVEQPKMISENFTMPAEPVEDVPPPPDEPPPPPTEETIAFNPPVIVDIPVDDEVPSQEQMEDTKASDKTQEGGDENWGVEVQGEEVAEKPVEVKEEEILDIVEEEAGFPGNVQEWIAKNIKYPESAIELGDQGRVFVQFVVEKNGDVSNVVILRGVSDDLDKEAKRVVKNMPNWKPAKNNGKSVRTYVRLPINFELN